jgi:MFS family permease
MTSLVEATLYFAFGFLEVYLPLRLTAAGLKAWQIGPLFTVQVLVAASIKPVMGRLADRWHRGALIAGGLISGAAALLLISAVQSYLLLAMSAGLFGLAMAAVTAATAALVSDLAQKDAYGAALGLLSSIMDVGHSAGPIVGGLIVGAFGYSTAFASTAVFLVVAAIVFLMVYRQQ